jgi:hypothetical protein
MRLREIQKNHKESWETLRVSRTLDRRGRNGWGPKLRGTYTTRPFRSSPEIFRGLELASLNAESENKYATVISLHPQISSSQNQHAWLTDYFGSWQF